MANREAVMIEEPRIARKRSFIEFLVNSDAHTWLSKVIIFGELAIALGLILGAFTGLAAFFGGMMNWNFIMAGSASTNGMLFAIATWLVLAWRNAGWIGLDRWLLPLVGTPLSASLPSSYLSCTRVGLPTSYTKPILSYRKMHTSLLARVVESKDYS
jgi:hypothetical protein